MKLTLFAMISFLAVTASASAIPGDSDYSVSRLEKRMGDEPYEEADEGAKAHGKSFKYRERAFKMAAEHYEEQREMERVLREGVEILEDELGQNDLTESERNDLENQLDDAIKAFESHSASMEASYKPLQESETAHSFKTIEKDTLRENQNRLREHNINNPDDPLEVEHGSVYNKIILEAQMNEICERQRNTFDDMKAANLVMSEALSKMAKKDFNNEDEPTPSDTSPLIAVNMYVGIVNGTPLGYNVPFSVDHCILCDQQLLSTSIAHLVVECEQVVGHRIQSGLVPAIQKSRLRLLGRALDPGVENVYTWLRGGVLNGEADLDQRWLDGTVEHESMGTRHDNRALAARNHGKGKPAPSGAFTHRIREDGEIFSGEEGRETSSDTTPLASVAGSVRMRSTDSDRSVRATPKKARDASPPPQDDLWVVVKNLSQQVAAQQAELDALRNAIALQQKATANLEKILGNMASQMTSTSEATQTALAAILARLEVGPVTMATKPNSNIATTTTTTTTTDQTSKDTRFADAVKKRPTHQQLVERQPEFRKAGAAAWLALKRETSVPAHSAPKVELSSGLRLIYASGFPYAKPGNLRKAMQGARIRTSAVRDIRWISRQVVQLLVDADYVSAFTRIITSLDATIVKSFKAWVPRSEAADKDKLAAILSFAAKTVTTIQRSPDVKARNFFRSLLASIGGKTLEAATAEAAKIRVQTPDFDISTLEIVPKESLPVKKATDKEPAAPAVDPPSDTAAEITPAIQDDGVAPTVTPIADVEMCL
ncbi:hypothetical protein BASA50_008459 [Batrachochytrium salamandrivorans]|uniref:GDP/GTP exchange factor Sec2 N-terminal domain-containing protein n=1 Tax=Batrachochytrium salamandrivorans TaxID=1357716 RepID=A0ABQ8F452_9FUNG|nr:hypothetical protein BASA50_008459 [Batrachochytrium salamandrivorans]